MPQIASIFEDTVVKLFRETIDTNMQRSMMEAFLAGAFVGMGYEVESNKESGLGRPDILLKDEDNRRAIIIEAKKSEKEADLDKDCDEAINQIITEKYAEGLYGYERILCYGVAFFRKQARVKLLTREY